MSLVQLFFVGNLLNPFILLLLHVSPQVRYFLYGTQDAEALSMSYYSVYAYIHFE